MKQKWGRVRTCPDDSSRPDFWKKPEENKQDSDGPFNQVHSINIPTSLYYLKLERC